MRKTLLIVLFSGLFFSGFSQSFNFNCTRDTAIACSLGCFSIIATIPDLHASSNTYSVNPISANGCYNPPVNPASPGPGVSLITDDVYSAKLNIGFPFTFFGQTYTKLVASTNGYVCFDTTRAGLFSHYQIFQMSGGLSTSGTPLDLPSTLYDKGLIMGPYHDLDPAYTTSALKQVKYDTIGVAPNRQWVLSFYKVPLFNCSTLFSNSSQIVLYEGTGIVDVFIAEQQICAAWQTGKAMVGMQDFSRTNSIMAPGRKASDPAWGAVPMNESWRFVPSEGPSLFKKVELYSLSGTLLSTGDTLGLGNGTLKATFLNVCPAIGGTTKVIVKSYYTKIDDPSEQIIGTDTINVIRNAGAVNATATGASCVTGQGTVTVNNPTGPTYEYSIDGGPWQSSNVFANVPAGTHTVTARIIASSCSSSTTVTISTVNTLTATASTVDAACTGSASGTITINASLGTPPYQYARDGGAYQASNVFNNVPSGNHTVIVKDAGGCTFTLTNIFVGSAGGLVASATVVNVSCPGANNGSITVNPQNGQSPFTYAINGGPFQASNVFSGLAAGNYSILVKDATGCTVTVNKTVGTNGGGFTATGASTPSGCSPSGTITITPDPAATGPFTYSLDGGPAQASNVFNGVPGGTHTVLVTQAGGCNTTVTVVVDTSSGITAVADSTNSECSGAFTGTITVTPSGGTGPYTFNIDGGAFQTSNIFSGLGVGPHNITVKDNSGCTFSFIKSVAAGAGITATATSTNTACAGISTGTITVTASGIAPYQYKIDGGPYQASNFFSNLAGGSHIINVRDAAGCIVQFTQTIGIDPGLTATAATTNTACASATNGTITVTASAGTAPYTYSINGGALGASNVFTNLPAATHTILVKDVSGCSFTFNQTITANAGVTAIADSTSTECSGASTGSITVSASSGITPYSYKIDAGVYQASNIFTGLAAGTHTITVKDFAGCTFTFSKGVAIGPGVNATASSTNTSCAGVSSGSITVTASGIAPYQYKIDGGAYQASNFFPGLAAGNHIILVKDAAGCTFQFTQTIGIDPGLTATATPTNTACANANNGTLTVNASLGTSPYTYSINGGALGASNIFTNLIAGSYTVLVKDASGCTFTFNQSVAADPGVTAIADSLNTACALATTGKIIIQPSSGISPYSYKIDGGAYQGSNIFSNLAAGTHIIVVKDSAGCTYTFTKGVAANAGVTSGSTTGPTGCPGSNTGIIQLQPSGGLTPYVFSLNGGAYQLSNTFSNLAAGTYAIVVKDSAGCTFSLSVIVGTNPLVTANLNVVQPSCYGTATGSIMVNASQGTGPYTYALNANSFQSNNVFSNLVTGSYSVHVKDANNCTFDTSLTLNQPALFKVLSDSTTPATCNGNDGVITIVPNGGTAPFLYSVDGGATYGTSNIIADTIGSYNIRIKDANGCTADSFAVITLNDQMTLSLSPDTTVCAGSTVAFTPTTNPQTNIFNWTPTGGMLNATTGAYSVTPTDTTTYFLTARWGSCQRSVSGTVDVLHKPVAHAGSDTIICDKTFAILRGSASNLSGPVSYLWSPAADISQPDTTTTMVTPKTNGAHIYTLEVDDNYGCGFKVFSKVTVTMNPPVPAFAGRDTIAAMDLPHQLFGGGGVSYLWTSTPFATLDDPTKKNPVAILHTDTRFLLTVVDNGGCVGTAKVFVKVYKGPTYYIPNAFTPNGDGLNDVFRAIPPGIASTEYFRIFNRWGQMIFETHDYLKGWDGSYIGKPQPAGAYVWIIKGVDKFGKTVQMRGTVMLIR